MATLSAIDSASPSIPSSVSFNYPTPTTLRLCWGASSDNVAVTGYRVDLATDAGFVNAVPGYLNKDMGNTFSIDLSGLASGTSYYARARAYDAAGNVSGNTPTAAIATLNANFAALSAPVNVTLGDVTSTTWSLSWAPSPSTGSFAVATYQVQLSTISTFSDFAGNLWAGSFYPYPTNSVTLSGLQAGTVYYGRVRALDAYSNASNFAFPVDRVPPSIPAGILWSNPTMTSLTLSWNASTDNVAVAGYRLDVSTSSAFSSFLSGYANKDVGNALSLLISGLSMQTAYYVRLRAYDAAGNISPYCNAAPGVTTGDAAAPSIPSSVSFNYPNTTTLRLCWGASTDNVAVAGYRIDLATDPGFVNAVPGYLNKNMGNAFYLDLAGLTPAVTYYGRVRAYDAAGNVSGNTPTAAIATLNANFAALSAPVNVTLAYSGLNTLSMSWMPSSAAGSFTPSVYQVQISTSPAFSDFAGNSWGGFFYQYPTRTAALSGLKAGTVYYGRVRANDAYGNASNYSSPASAIVAASRLSTFASSVLDAGRVYPNPWRRDRHSAMPVTFDQLSMNSTVKIFTVAGHWLATLDASSGSARWNLMTDSGDNAASGIYLYLITNAQGQTAHGLFAVIR